MPFYKISKILEKGTPQSRMEVVRCYGYGIIIKHDHAGKVVEQTRTIFILFPAVCDSVPDAENIVAPELEF